MNRRKFIRDLGLLVSGISEIAQAATPVSSKPPVGSPAISPRQFGARGDGRTDDSVALQKTVDYATSRHLPIRLPAGDTYLLSSTINVSKQGLTLLADQASILVADASQLVVSDTYSGEPGHTLFLLQGGKTTADRTLDLYVQGLTVRCMDGQRKMIAFRAHGGWDTIIFRSCSGHNLGLTFAMVGEIFTSARGSNAAYYAHSAINHFIATACYIEGGGKGQDPSSFHVLGCRDSLVAHNRFKFSSGYQLWFDGGQYDTVPSIKDGSLNIRIFNNTFLEWGSDGSSTNALQCTKSCNIYIENNQFQTSSKNSDHTADLFNCFNAVYRSNTVIGAGCLFFGHGDLNHGSHPEDLVGAHQVYAGHNHVSNPTGYAIFTFGGDGTVDGNRAMHNGVIEYNTVLSDQPASNAFFYGFLANQVMIRFNEVHKCKNFIHTFYSKALTVFGNTVYDMPTLVNLEGADGETTATERQANNRLINSGSVNDFSALIQ